MLSRNFRLFGSGGVIDVDADRERQSLLFFSFPRVPGDGLKMYARERKKNGMFFFTLDAAAVVSRVRRVVMPCRVCASLCSVGSNASLSSRAEAKASRPCITDERSSGLPNTKNP